MPELQEFVNIFGNRFPGLHDPGSQLYNIYRVPNPEAPYPQDYIIDQEGRIAYWLDEYDPQEIIRIIDNLLGFPEEIQNLAVKIENGNLILEWEAVTGAAYYNIYIGDSSDFIPSGDPYDIIPAENCSWSAPLSAFGEIVFFNVTSSTE